MMLNKNLLCKPVPSLLCIFIREIKMYVYKKFWKYAYIHYSTLFTITPNWKQPKCLSMNEKIVLHPHDGMLLSNEKGWTTDKCNIVDKFQKHYNQWKKPGTKYHICMISLTWYILKNKPIGTEIWWVVARSEGQKEETDCKRQGEI